MSTRSIVRILLLAIFAGVLLANLSLTAASSCGGYHVVRQGETLNAIARRYSVSAQAIAEANHLTNPDWIFPGQKLYIPCKGYKAAPTYSKQYSAPSYSRYSYYPAHLWYGYPPYHYPRYRVYPYPPFYPPFYPAPYPPFYPFYAPAYSASGGAPMAAPGYSYP
jgi:murein DD-endopeptidase MepM/ murein hydrolase activator NlpD